MCGDLNESFADIKNWQIFLYNFIRITDFMIYNVRNSKSK